MDNPEIQKKIPFIKRLFHNPKTNKNNQDQKDKPEEVSVPEDMTPEVSAPEPVRKKEQKPEEILTEEAELLSFFFDRWQEIPEPPSKDIRGAIYLTESLPAFAYLPEIYELLFKASGGLKYPDELDKSKNEHPTVNAVKSLEYLLKTDKKRAGELLMSQINNPHPAVRNAAIDILSLYLNSCLEDEGIEEVIKFYTTIFDLKGLESETKIRLLGFFPSLSNMLSKTKNNENRDKINNEIIRLFDLGFKSSDIFVKRESARYLGSMAAALSGDKKDIIDLYFREAFIPHLNATDKSARPAFYDEEAQKSVAACIGQLYQYYPEIGDELYKKIFQYTGQTEKSTMISKIYRPGEKPEAENEKDQDDSMSPVNLLKKFGIHINTEDSFNLPVELIAAISREEATRRTFSDEATGLEPKKDTFEEMHKLGAKSGLAKLGGAFSHFTHSKTFEGDFLAAFEKVTEARDVKIDHIIDYFEKGLNLDPAAYDNAAILKAGVMKAVPQLLKRLEEEGCLDRFTVKIKEFILSGLQSPYPEVVKAAASNIPELIRTLRQENLLMKKKTILHEIFQSCVDIAIRSRAEYGLMHVAKPYDAKKATNARVISYAADFDPVLFYSYFQQLWDEQSINDPYHKWNANRDNDPDHIIRGILAASSLGELTKCFAGYPLDSKELQSVIRFYREGLRDNNSTVRRNTAVVLDILAKNLVGIDAREHRDFSGEQTIYFKEFFEPGLESNDSRVVRQTERSLGSYLLGLAEAQPDTVRDAYSYLRNSIEHTDLSVRLENMQQLMKRFGIKEVPSTVREKLANDSTFERVEALEEIMKNSPDELAQSVKFYLLLNKHFERIKKYLEKNDRAGIGLAENKIGSLEALPALAKIDPEKVLKLYILGMKEDLHGLARSTEVREAAFGSFNTLMHQYDFSCLVKISDLLTSGNLTADAAQTSEKLKEKGLDADNNDLTENVMKLKNALRAFYTAKEKT